MIPYLWIPAITTAITLIYASYLDVKTRFVPFVTWIPMVVIGTVFSSFYWYSLENNPLTLIGFLGVVATILALRYLDAHQFKLQGLGAATVIAVAVILAPVAYFNVSLLAMLVFCILVFIFGKLGLMGGADVWALCFITIAIPASPITGTFLLGLLPYLVISLALGIGIAFMIATWITGTIKKSLVDFMYPFIVPITIAFFIAMFL